MTHKQKDPKARQARLLGNAHTGHTVENEKHFSKLLKEGCERAFVGL